MKHLRLALVAATFFTVFGLMETRVQAQILDGGFGYGWYPYWFGGPAYQSSAIPTPPYFAIHPPVYYGTRVGMPYGNSPITRPPRPIVRDQIRSYEPEAAPVGQWIENPFYAKTEEADKAKPREERKRRVSPTAETAPTIDNPYFVGGDRS
jgi:hypothetical protein